MIRKDRRPITQISQDTDNSFPKGGEGARWGGGPKAGTTSNASSKSRQALDRERKSQGVARRGGFTG